MRLALRSALFALGLLAGCELHAELGRFATRTDAAPSDRGLADKARPDSACHVDTPCGVVKDGCCPPRCNGNTDADCPGVCGNGALELSERCDTKIPAGILGACPTSCDDKDACTTDTLSGTDCLAQCLYTKVTQCSGATQDGCCPAGCNANTDKDCVAVCGNGALEPGEKCDPKIAVGLPGACQTACTQTHSCEPVLLVNAGSCDAECMKSTIVQCQDGDGCCPTGCTHVNDKDCFEMLNANTTATISGLWGTSPTNMHFTGWNSTFLHFNGKTFTALPGAGLFMMRMWGTAWNNIWAIGEEALVRRFDGTSWKPVTVPIPITTHLYGIWGRSENEIVIVGGTPIDGVALHYDGTSFKATTEPEWRGAVWGFDMKNIWSVGDKARVRYYDGQAWSSLPATGGTKTQRGIWGTSPTNIYITDQSGSVIHYDGKTFSTTLLKPKTWSMNVWGTSPSNIYATADSYLFHFDGKSWKELNTGVPTQYGLFDVWGIDGVLFAVGQNGVIIRRGN